MGRKQIDCFHPEIERTGQVAPQYSGLSTGLDETIETKIGGARYPAETIELQNFPRSPVAVMGSTIDELE